MLGINPEDVIRVVKSIQTQLIVIGIILLAAGSVCMLWGGRRRTA